MAGVVASADGSSGGSAPTLTKFEVLSPKVSPAILRLEASAGVVVELSFRPPGGLEEAMTGLTGPGVVGNRVQLPSGTTELTWNFAGVIGATFVADVDLFARFSGGVPIGGGTLRIGLGNDVPVVELVEPVPTDPEDRTESSGNVEVRMIVSDTSSDVVELDVEWRRASDPPDVWQAAAAAGVFPEGIEADPDGIELSFFWNTNIDLAEGDDDVLLRVTPDDRTTTSFGVPVGEGEPVESALFHIDNNEEPIVTIDTGFLFSNPDERRGIPIPYRVVDEEEDPVRVVFQWRRPDAEFPALPSGRGELEAILADSALRRELQVCSEFPIHASGHVTPLGDRAVRLQELASTESWILDYGIEGRTLEILRQSSSPELVSPFWRTNPLVGPVSALPLGDGRTALVLDGSAARLREIEIATGVVVREIAALGSVRGTAMAMVPGGEVVLVATDLDGSWRIDRVVLGTGSIDEILSAGPASPRGPIRGLASRGDHAAVFTAGSTLMHVDYGDPGDVRSGPILTGLAAPWGIAVDEDHSTRLYLAEREGGAGSGRILLVQLDSHQSVPVVVGQDSLDPPGVEHPEALALERDGSRLLVAAESAGQPRLFGFDVLAREGNEAFAIGLPMTSQPSSVASGPDGLRLLAFAAQNSLGVAGGVEQARSIDAYDPATRTVTVAVPFDPAALAGRTWRIQARDGDPPRPPQSESRRFCWDSSDVPGGGLVSLRAIVMDEERGSDLSTSPSKSVAHEIGSEVLRLSLANASPQAVTAADVDGDGDRDLVSVDGNDLAVFLQSGFRTFDSPPLLLSGAGGSTNDVAVADLDGDGDQDIVSADESSGLIFFTQAGQGAFFPPDILIAGDCSYSVSVADLDGDGDQDLVSGSSCAPDLAINFQTQPGSFGSSPTLLSVLSGCPRDVTPADLDGDGDLDLVSSNDCAGSLLVCFQDSAGAFGSVVPVGGANQIASSSVATGDLDGDGDVDLVGADGQGNMLLFHQIEPGFFNPFPDVVGGSLDTIRSLEFADLDSDGDGELITAVSSILRVFYQDSRGAYSAQVSMIEALGQFVDVTVSDLDGDGGNDLAAAALELQVWFQRTLLAVSRDPFVIMGDTVTLPWSVTSGDMDEDGDLDIVSTRVTSGLEIQDQIAPGAFDPNVLVLVAATGHRSCAAADLDGNGSLDLVAGGRSPLLVFFQQEHSFSAEPLRVGRDFESLSPQSIGIADYDNDGDLDLAAPKPSGGGATIHLQLATQIFDEEGIVLKGLRMNSVAATDIDDDGDQDLVSFGETETIFMQITPLAFEPVHLASSNGALSCVVADVDRDGNKDIIAAISNGGIKLSFQGHDRTFSTAPLVLASPAVVRPFCVAVEDLDGDGYPDIATTILGDFQFRGSGVAIFDQRSPRVFDPIPRMFTDSQMVPTSIVVPDLEGDGDRDLVVANALTSSILVFWSGR